MGPLNASWVSRLAGSSRNRLRKTESNSRCPQALRRPSHLNLTHRRLEALLSRMEHWNVAQNAGRSVAANIIDPSAAAKAFIPIFWSALGSQLRYCGNTPNGFDDLVLQGQPDEAKFVAYYTKGETVVAVGTMGIDPVMTASSELMRRGAMPSKSDLKKGVDVLSISIPAEVKI